MTYYIGTQIKLYRKLAVDYLGGRCAKCGSPSNLHIHHKNGLSDKVEDIELLCASCHAKEHRPPYAKILGPKYLMENPQTVKKEVK